MPWCLSVPLCVPRPHGDSEKSQIQLRSLLREEAESTAWPLNVFMQKQRVPVHIGRFLVWACSHPFLFCSAQAKDLSSFPSSGSWPLVSLQQTVQCVITSDSHFYNPAFLKMSPSKDTKTENMGLKS